MRIAIAQLKPVAGNVKANIESHKKLARIAISKKAEIVVFPELSITGYEPKMAKQLASSPGDKRLDEFQEICNNNSIVIGVGMPLKVGSDICISLIIFEPGR